MKRLCAALLSFFVIFSNIITVTAENSLPKVSSEGAVILDATTKKVLYDKNSDIKYPPASTTKIMTALLTLENCDLNEEVTISKTPESVEGSKIFIFEGEVLKIKDLLYALLLASANDCAEALAEHISGSVPKFVKLMNKRAKELGCTNTNFVNPHGLYDENHRTTAKDLALIMSELVKKPEYIKIATSLSYNISPTNKCKDYRPLWNRDRLVQKNSSLHIDGIEGGKTGYTIQSKHSYVSSVTQNNQRLIIALLYDEKKHIFQDANNLFKYAFKNFHLKKLYSKGDIVTKTKIDSDTIDLIASDDFYYVSKKNYWDPSNIKINLENKDLSNTSFNKNEKILKAFVLSDTENLGTIDLLSNSKHIVNNNFFSFKTVLITLFIIVVILICILKISIIKKNKKRNKRK